MTSLFTINRFSSRPRSVTDDDTPSWTSNDLSLNLVSYQSVFVNVELDDYPSKSSEYYYISTRKVLNIK